MVLLTGPAGSGKSFRILGEFREALRRKDRGIRLLTPTATMAQHLQDGIAREGFVFHPEFILTLSRFVDAFAADLPQVSEPLLYLIVEEAARRVSRPEFAKVVRLPGFCASLARTIEELSSAGCDAAKLGLALARHARTSGLGEAFLDVYSAVESELARRGLAMRAQRLLHAAGRMKAEGLGGVHTIWLDGFYALPDPELAIIGAMCGWARVTLSLPAAPITEPSQARLLAIGFAEEACTWQGKSPHKDLCETPAIEREVDEISRRILEHANAGRQYHEMGIIVRSPEIYEPILRAGLNRFGIPAKFYFDGELLRHPVVRFLVGVVEALLGGWEHSQTLAVLRLAPRWAGDAFDFAVREQLPGSGLGPLKRIAGEGQPAGLLNSLENLDALRSKTLTPAVWAERLQNLRELYPLGRPEPGDYEVASAGRSHAAVLQLFDGALDEAAKALPEQPVMLDEYWRAAKSVLRLTPLRIDDHRRNVVHVLGAHEARQWRLPVVFVCGLVEKQFPKFHTQDPFFPEAARTQLKQSGIRIRTAGDFEAEERFLFDSAVTRATGTLTLSYPRYDARGQQNLRSLFLEGIEAPLSPWTPARPQPARDSQVTHTTSAIQSADLRRALVEQHMVFRPTALESYLQCPFQFFGRHTLRLEAAPERPEERLSFMAEGTIVHAVLAELLRDSRPFEEVFESVFRRICEQEHIPASYRTEACRERLITDLRQFLENGEWPRGFDTRTEQKFQYALQAGVEIKGRIDRLDITSDGRAFVIDYKYSGAQNTKNKLDEDNRLQPQLYILAAERVFSLRAVGMFYCGLRGGVKWAGWTDAQEVAGRAFPPGWLEQAIETTLRAAGEIRAGRVAPDPADPEQCGRCDYRDICRFETAGSAIAEGA